MPELMRDLFTPKEQEGHNKITDIRSAVKRYIAPGMTIHLGSDAMAASCEILRCFWESRPRFILAATFIEEHFLNLVHANLVDKIICAYFGNLNPTTSPSRIAQRATQKGSLEVENWTLHTLLQRFMAAALGIPFMPTRSLDGSTMAEENIGYKAISDPFHSDSTIGAVSALYPDISVVHVLAADASGNAIPFFGDSESYWGARASRGGVIITAENIVPTQFIREYSAFVRIPGHMVKAVCPARFGAHPQSFFNRWIKDVVPYAEDKEFVWEQRRAAESEETLDKWIREWVLETGSLDGYLQKLGDHRLESLKSRANESFWQQELELKLEGNKQVEDFNPTEMMIVAAARKMEAIIRLNGYRVLLCGIGTGGLATYLAYYKLRSTGYDLDPLIGTGPYGFLPRVANFDTIHNLDTAKMVGDVVDIYGVILRGVESKSLGALGAAVVDKHGNINSTRNADGTHLTGSGGANDLAAGSTEAVVIAPHSVRRLVDQVNYITVPGDKVRTLITDKGILEKLPSGDGEELILTAYFTNRDMSKVECVQEIKDSCGWDLKIKDEVELISPPTSDELNIVRAMDPTREFLR